jgi:hypothetical protein
MLWHEEFSTDRHAGIPALVTGQATFLIKEKRYV